MPFRPVALVSITAAVPLEILRNRRERPRDPTRIPLEHHVAHHEQNNALGPLQPPHPQSERAHVRDGLPIVAEPDRTLVLSSPPLEGWPIGRGGLPRVEETPLTRRGGRQAGVTTPPATERQHDNEQESWQKLHPATDASQGKKSQSNLKTSSIMV